jgi:hypothetical protein
MAKLIKVDGTVTEVSPKDGKHFSLEELQEFVGGDIQMVQTISGRLMYMDEEGKLKNKPVNEKATDLFGYRAYDLVVGDVLICDLKDVNTE